MTTLLNKQLSSDDLKEIILYWNINFPIDRWWRKTYNISFNSAKHRETSFIDMWIDYLESSLFKEFMDEVDKEKYVPGKGNWLKKREVSQELSDEAFEGIDLEKL